MSVTVEQARAAKEAVQKLAEPLGPVAVGITKIGADYAVKVNLRAPLPKGRELPATVQGVKVQVEVIGKIVPR